MTTDYEHKGLGEGLTMSPARSGPLAAGWGPEVCFGGPCPIGTLDGRKFAPARGMETKEAGSYDEVLADARRRVTGATGDDRGDDHDAEAEEDDVIPYREIPTAGPDEQVVLEAPPQSLTEKEWRLAMVAQMVAEAHLPPPGPPRGMRIRFRSPYSRSMKEIYESITGTEVKTFVTGADWSGHYDRRQPDELWVDIARYGHDLPRTVLHEMTHAWRCRTPEARTMTAEELELEAWSWADALLVKVFEWNTEMDAAPEPEGDA